MKKLFLITLILSFSQFLLADGLETFVNFPEAGSTYEDGTFIGQDGSVWTYWQCRGDLLITDETPCLGKNRIPVSEVLIWRKSMIRLSSQLIFCRLPYPELTRVLLVFYPISSPFFSIILSQ